MAPPLHYSKHQNGNNECFEYRFLKLNISKVRRGKWEPKENP
jgi:hypothetical protein